MFLYHPFTCDPPLSEPFAKIFFHIIFMFQTQPYGLGMLEGIEFLI